jgi:hypothetical protein
MTNKAESSQVWFATALTGPLLYDEEIARKFAALILERLHGAVEVVKQQPLRIIDQGTDWVVIGSFQEPERLPDIPVHGSFAFVNLIAAFLNSAITNRSTSRRTSNRSSPPLRSGNKRYQSNLISG